MEKTHLYLANVKDLDLEKCLPQLPEFRRKRVEMLGTEINKKLSASVWLILKKSLAKLGYNIKNYEFKLSSKGKPYFEGNPVYFSYSHSGEYIILAISDEEVGIDIQEHRNFSFKVIDVMFNMDDLQYYVKAENKNNAFYDIWSSKEAYGKMTGEGICKETSPDYKANSTKLINLLSNYSIALISEKDYEFETIDLNE